MKEKKNVEVENFLEKKTKNNRKMFTGVCKCGTKLCKIGGK
jgi:hypothetical protein